MKKLLKFQKAAFKAFIMNLILDYLDRREESGIFGILQRDERFYKMEYQRITKARALQLMKANFADSKEMCFDIWVNPEKKESRPQIEENKPETIINLN